MKNTADIPIDLPAKATAEFQPDQDAFNNKQIDLFQTFLYNTEDEKNRLSNALDLWDSIPRYSVSRLEMTKRRSPDGSLPILTIPFNFKGQSYVVKIQPAMVEEGGGTVHYYPSANEELIEDALRKIAAKHDQGFFDPKNGKLSGVSFSLYELREELSSRKHTRSYQEIILSLEILRKSHMEIRKADERSEAFVAANYLPGLAAATKGKLAEEPNARWVVQFNPLVTRSIDQVTYRQFNYALMMSLPTQLARWLHKQLAVKFTFAGMLANPFEMRYSTIKRDSSLLNRSRERDNIRDVDEALEQLKKSGVLREIEKERLLGDKGKILDVTYKLFPTPEYVKEVKAANKRMQIQQE